MNKKSFGLVSIAELGALNGLLVGLTLEEARILYVNYTMNLAAREYAQSDWAVDFVEARWEPVVPLVCIAIFALAAYLVSKHFVIRPAALFLLWCGLGAVALSAGYFMSASKPSALSLLSVASLAALSYFAHRLWRNRPDSLSLFWIINGISALILAAFVVQLLGMFFYWKNLRSPLLWLICLVLVIATNSLFGALIQFVLDRSSTKLTRANS